MKQWGCFSWDYYKYKLSCKWVVKWVLSLDKQSPDLSLGTFPIFIDHGRNLSESGSDPILLTRFSMRWTRFRLDSLNLTSIRLSWDRTTSKRIWLEPNIYLVSYKTMIPINYFRDLLTASQVSNMDNHFKFFYN